MISVSNDCRGGSNCCVMVEFVVYWFKSHSNLVLEMVYRWFPLFVYISALSCMIWMVGLFVFILVFGLHLFRFIWTNGSCMGSCMYLVSLDCFW